MKRILKTLIIPATFTAAHSATLTNGTLTVDIRDDNGAIDGVSFGGTDYFNPGTAVSDWGFQTGNDTATFVVNDTSGAVGQTVTVTPSSVVSGLYTEGGATVAFARAYSIIAGTNTLQIDMSYLNLGPTITLRQFETFDPDQGTPLGLGSPTRNDVFSLAGNQVAQARIEGASSHTVVLGSSSASYTVASGFPFEIDGGTALNDFFTSPFDGDDALADSGMHIGFERELASGESASYTTYLAFGVDPSSARASYLSSVPEPSSGLLGAIGVCALVRRRV